MSNLALTLEETPRVEAVRAPENHDSIIITGEILLLGLCLSLLQVADGILTGIGVSYFGTSVEGNSFIRFLMESFGTVHTLVLVKALAIVIVVALCRLAIRVAWLRSALKAVIGLYLFAAIIPWTYILVTHAL